MNDININEIVKIEQMPKVFSQLEKIGQLIDEKINDLDKLECNEENKQEVKNRRSEINKTLEALEERRKEIKNKLLESYDTFEDKYNKECKEKLQNASELLKNKIDIIEYQQKQEKENELRDFVSQHIEANNLQDILTFEDLGLKITLSASMKSLKEQAKEYIEEISNNIELIKLEEYSDEILLEYKTIWDFTKAKLKVIERHKRLEELQKAKEEFEERKKQEEKIEEVVDKVIEITAPKEIINDEDIIKVQFTIETTKSNIIKLKDFLKENNINYE